MPEFNQQLCETRHETLEKEKEILFKKVSTIEKNLYGNGETGYIAKVNFIWKWYQTQTATKAGLFDWAFRVLITIILTFIAVKVGLK